MYSSTTTHQSNVAGRQHGRVLYLYLPTCIALGCLALACTYSDETTEPDGIMPEYETSKGDPAVSNHASRLEIYREGTSMAGASRCLSFFRLFTASLIAGEELLSVCGPLGTAYWLQPSGTARSQTSLLTNSINTFRVPGP